LLPLERLAAAVIFTVTAALFFNANVNFKKKYPADTPISFCFLEREVEVLLKKCSTDERYRVEKGINTEDFFNKIGVKRCSLPYKKSKKEEIKRKRTIIVE
jgi:hypothetical protein